MRIALFFGSFNPIHIGHLIIANYVANYAADKVWFIVSPQNPFKQNVALLKAESRLNLVKLAIENDDRFEISDIEFHLPTPSYTINTLKAISSAYPQHEFCVLIGSDNFPHIFQWKSGTEIIDNYKILVYKRPGFSINNQNIINNNITFLNTPLLGISATGIREMIAKNVSIRYLVPEKVYAEISTHGYFK